MERPCVCNRVVLGQAFDAGRDCRPCWLFHHDADYNLAWGSNGTVQAAGNAAGRRRSKINKTPCRHLGVATGERHDCETCGGAKDIPLFHCGKHGQCTVERRLIYKKDGFTTQLPWCRICPDHEERESMGSITTRHLLYHVCPVAGNNTWLRNILHLCKRIDLFNGKRIVAIVTGRGLDHPDRVKKAFGDKVGEYFVVANNPSRREVATFLPLWARVQTDDPSVATFYAHAKGVTRPLNPGVTIHPWTAMMYETNLDYWPLVERTLQDRGTAGSFKKVGRCFGRSASSWHYSGTFYWVRNAELFRRDWRRIDPVWWGTESYLGLHFRPDEAGSLFHEAPGNVLDLYHMGYLRGTVIPQLKKWRQEHENERSQWDATSEAR